MIREVFECMILTVIFECGFAYLMGIRDKEDLSLIAIVNCITNPLLVLASYTLMYLFGTESGMRFTYLVLEPLVILSEYLLYQNKLHTRYNLLLVSAVLNLVSIAGGYVWRIFF